MSSSGLRIALCLTVTVFSSFARSKPSPAEKDSFDVVGHIVLNGCPVTSIVTTSHYSRNYVYAECATVHTVTLLDVTDSAHPNVLSNLNGSNSLLTAAGDAALISSEPSAAAHPVKTISIVDFSDKANPKVVREFAGVTSMTSDDHRGLVFLTNGEGLWILHRNQPVDPEIQERYAHDVVYNH